MAWNLEAAQRMAPVMEGLAGEVTVDRGHHTPQELLGQTGKCPVSRDSSRTCVWARKPGKLMGLKKRRKKKKRERKGGEEGVRRGSGLPVESHTMAMAEPTHRPPTRAASFPTC